MEFLHDFKFWSFCISGLTFLGVMITALINKITSDKITNNHLAHIAQDLKDVKIGQEKQDEKIEGIEKSLAYIQGQTDSNNKIVELLEKSLRN